MTWEKYQVKTIDRKPSPLLVKAVTTSKKALDFGAGSLTDSKFLLSKGFDIVALDSTKVVTIEDPHFIHAISTFEKFTYPKDTFDLIHGRFAFPFIYKDDFPRVWKALFNSLREGGTIVGDFFGDRDDWAKDPQFGLEEKWEGETNMLFFTKAEVEELLEPYDIQHFEEKEYDRDFVLGQKKHWHVFQFIAKKI